MSSYHREPVYYAASAPSRSYHPTTHAGRSRSASHSSSSHSGDPYYHSSGHRRVSTSHGHSPAIYYVTNTRSDEEPRSHRSTAATYYYPTTSRGYEHKDSGHHRRYSHGDSDHHRRESRNLRYRDTGRSHHSEGHHDSVGEKLRRLLGMPPHHRVMYRV